jgi:nitrogenase molybdenum-iron protein NifN
MAAEALSIPLFRVGFPIFDQLGHQHRSLGGYVGTRGLLFELANLFQSQHHEPKIEDFTEVLPPLTVEDTRHVAA